jgi:RNA polymerase sigma-70 factor, ECF subfamily
MEGALSDEEIVELVRGGRLELFGLLIRRHDERLKRAVGQVLKDDSAAEDVVQEAYMRAFSHLEDFAGLSRFSSWLTRIAVNEAVGRVRKAQNVDLVDLAFVELGDDAGGPEDAAVGREMGELLQRAIDALPDGYREVFVMRELHGLSVAQTAEALGITSEAVKMRSFRAHARLRALLDGWLEEKPVGTPQQVADAVPA